MLRIHLLLIALACARVRCDDDPLEFQKVMATVLKKTPYIRLELREGVRSDVDNTYVDLLLKQTYCPVVLSTYSLNEPIVHNLRESFAIVTAMAEFHDVVQHFARAAGTFFFIIPDEIDIAAVDTILRKLWYTRGIYRILLLTAASRVLYYDPFALDKQTQQYGNVMLLRKINLEHAFDDMNGYPIRVQIFKSIYAQPQYEYQNGVKRFSGAAEGADAVVAFTLQERMNFTMVLQEPTTDYYGERAPNGTYNGAIGMITKGETDITMSGYFVKDYMVPEMEFSVAVYDDQLCCYVPKAPRIPQSILPIFAVRLDFWLGFILTGFACGTVWVVIRSFNLWMAADELAKLHMSRKLRYQLVRIYIDTWVVWVRVSISSYPPFMSERLYILSLCLVSVIFGAIIESSLATVYIHPMYYKDINTLQELDKSGLDIVYKYTNFKDDLFFSETSPLFAALNKKLRHLNDLNMDLTSIIAEKGGFASVTRYSSLMMQSISYILSKKVHVVKECPKYYTIAYILPKDSPFGERINALLLRFLNAGLINKWIENMHAKANMVIMKTQEIEDSAVFKVLTMVDLQLGFYVVAFGSVMGVMSLAVELYLKRKERTQSVLDIVEDN